VIDNDYKDISAKTNNKRVESDIKKDKADDKFCKVDGSHSHVWMVKDER